MPIKDEDVTSADLVLKRENIPEKFLKTCDMCIVRLDFHQVGNQT